MRQTSQLYVLTGAPGAGKSTTLTALGELGFRIVPEAARVLLEKDAENGRCVQESRANERSFQDRVLPIKAKTERWIAESSPAPTFLDRGIPDTLAFYKFYGWPPPRALLRAVKSTRYDAVFVLELLPMPLEDNLRVESTGQRRLLHDLLVTTYHACRVPVVPIPLVPTEQRVDMILSWLRRNTP